MGTLQIEWDNVAQVTAPEFFEVEHMNGGLSFGALKPGPSADTMEIVADWGSGRAGAVAGGPDPAGEGGFREGSGARSTSGAGYTSATERSS